jgi:AraC family transcriptional regulator of adaptative response/methylated-DNA-[protein]-cysteine methyltransferase
MMTAHQAFDTTWNEDDLYERMVARDRTLDGFVYVGVTSTGVYCRAGSCPSRTPKRANVRFYDSPDDAEAAGFRACLRCKPRDTEPQLAYVERACRYIEEHIDEPITLDALGEAVSVSPTHLQRTFKRIVGVSPREYAARLRVSGLKTSLRNGADVTTAIYDAGFSSPSRLYERANSDLGMTPNTYRNGGNGQTITYAIAGSPLGRVLVGMTNRGVCAVRLGDDDAELEDGLKQEFPSAQIQRGNGDHADWVNAVVSTLSGKRPAADVPLDIAATAFQQRVWDALKSIPSGETRTYTDLAEAIGNPAAVRAVAHACAANPVAVVVPCHRVIRTDGGLGGYRWGLERKEALLAQEAAVTVGE